MNEQGSIGGVVRRYTIQLFPSDAVVSRLRSFLPVLPVVLLLIGFSTTILFGNVYTGYFLNPVFSEHLTMAMNLSLDNHFLGFRYQSFDTEGNIDWDPYNRFPPGGYVLIKLITYPFKGDLSILVYVAALFMVALFAGAAVLAYLSICRLTSNRWISLTATLMGFSSIILLQYNTTIFVDGGPSLFGFALTFYGMVIFIQEGRFKQLIIKACLALLLGWHVLALLFAFVLLGLAKEVVIVRKARTLRKLTIAVVTSRYFILGVITFGFGLLILTHNMANEYYALNIRSNHRLDLSDLPSFRSMLRRTQLASNYTPKDDTLLVPFLELQLERIGLTVVPFIGRMSVLESYLTGLVVVITCGVGTFFIRSRLLATTAVLAGFCWAIPMFHTSHRHNHESMYYVGISLFFITLLLLLILELTANLDVFRKSLMPISSIVSLFIFGLSSYHMISVPVDDELRFQELSEEFDTIREFTKGKTLLVYSPEDLTEPSDSIWVHEQAIQLLSGNGNSIIFYDFDCDSSLNKVDFIIQTRKENVPSLLTPQNQVVFLYDRYAYEEGIDRLVEEDRSVFRGGHRGHFDVYLTGRKLIYVGSNCDESLPLNVPISLSIYPVDTEDIPDPSQGHESISLSFVDHFVMDAKRHIMIFDLPDYDVSSISTGQYTDEGEIWGGRFFGPEHVVDADLIERVGRAVTSREPIVHDHFNIYLTDERTLIYVKESCSNGDISEDFFVHIVPIDTKDLPEHRRQYEFDNLDFAFVDRGFKENLRCAAVIELPDYDITRIRTGQYTDEGPIWQSDFAVTDG